MTRAGRGVDRRRGGAGVPVAEHPLQLPPVPRVPARCRDGGRCAGDGLCRRRHALHRDAGVDLLPDPRCAVGRHVDLADVPGDADHGVHRPGHGDHAGRDLCRPAGRAGAKPRGRDRRAQAHRGGADRGAPPGRGGQPRQVAIPRDDEPRDPHADERRARHRQPARVDTAQRAAATSWCRTWSRSGQALLGIINDILDLSKIEAGRFELVPVEFDPRELVAEVTDLFCERCTSKGLEFVYFVGEDVPRR